MKKLLLILASVFALTSVVHAATVFQVIQGGTGASTFGVGLCLKGNGTSPITAGPCSSGGAGTGTVATSTPLVSGQVDFSTGVDTIGNDSNFLWDNSLKILTALNASFTNSTSTSFFATTASTTNFFGAGLPLAGCSGTSALTYNGTGRFTCTAQPQGTVTAISVSSANGFAGSSSGGATPALTLTTTISGLLKGNGTAISAASSGTDYAPATSGSSLLYGNGAGGFSNATVGTGLSFAGGTLSATAGSVSTSTATTTVWIDQNNTKTAPNGTIENPYTTITSAVKSYPATYHVAPGTYNEGNCNPLSFNATSTVYADQAVILCWSGTPGASGVGTINFNSGVILQAPVIALGHVAFTDTSLSDPATSHDAYFGGNLTLSGLSTIQGGQLIGGEIYLKPGSLTAFSFNEINDLIGVAGTANFDTLDLNVSAVGAGKYAITSTTTGIIQINGMSLENLAASGGGIYCKGNGATATQPNAISAMSGIVGTTTDIGAFNCGNSPVEAGPYTFTSSTNGQRLYGSVNTNIINFSFLGLNTESTTTLAAITGRVGVGTTSPSRTFDVYGSNSGTSLLSASSLALALTNTNQTDGNFEDLSFLTIDSAGAAVIGAKMSGIIQSHTAGAVSADLAFVTKNGGTTGERVRINSWGAVGIGTTTPQWLLQLATSTKPQLTLSDPSTLTNNHWSVRNAGGIFYLATSSPGTFATSSVSALTIDANGFPTWPALKGVGCAQFDANGKETNTGVACGTGGGGTNTDKFATGTPATAIYPNSADRFFVGLTSGGTARVEIQGSTTAATDQSLLVWNSNGATGPILSALNSQKVGVATATPFSNLTVATSSVANAAFPIGLAIGPRGLTSGSANGTIIGVNTDVFTGNLIELQNNGTSEFKVDSAGAVTAATSYTSGASSNYIFSGRSRLGSSADGLLELQNNAGTAFTQLNFGGATSAFPAFARVNQAFVVRLGDQTNGGYFAVGTSTPQFLTELSSSTAPQLVLDNTFGITDGKHLIQDWTGSQFRIGTSSDSTFTSTSTALILDTQQPPSIVVGTTTSAAVVSVGTANYQSAIASSTALAFFGYLGSSTPSFMIESANNNGTVLVATTTNAVNKLAAFATGGKVYMSGLTTSGSSQTGYLCYDGNGQVIQDTAVCLVSALKFKKDINPLALGLNAVLAMKPVTYYLKEPFGKEDAGEQIGFVADWSEEVVPDLVTHDSNGDVHAFNYQQYTAVLTKAIQELNAKVGETTKSAEDKWQDIALVLFGLYVIYNEINKRRTQ